MQFVVATAQSETAGVVKPRCPMHLESKSFKVELHLQLGALWSYEQPLHLALHSFCLSFSWTAV